MLSGAELTGAAIDGGGLLDRRGARARRGRRCEAIYELRYRGQSFELPVDGPLDADPERLIEAFAAEHERRYGYREDGGEIELVNVRLAVPRAAGRLRAAGAGRRGAAPATRRAPIAGRAW